MRTDWTISACCHVVVLGAAMVSFSPARLLIPPVESIPVNIVTDTDKGQMTHGQTNASKDAKQPFAEKVDTPNPVANPDAKIAPREVRASTDSPQPSPPEPKQAPKKAEPNRDLIAEALKKDAAKEAAKKAEQKKADHKKAVDAKAPPKRPPTPKEQPKFDPREMQALLDKRSALRKEATGATISDEAPLGTARGKAVQLSQNEMDALRARLTQLWNPPEAKNPEEILVTVRFRLKPDGTLDGFPMIMTSGRSMLFMVSRERAVNAIMRGQPFKMLRPENYEAWRDLEVTFDPRDLPG